jgi:hypothetical protein
MPSIQCQGLPTLDPKIGRFFKISFRKGEMPHNALRLKLINNKSGGDVLHKVRVAANVLNKGWSSRVGVWRGANKSLP